jgi:triphosphoribosyl-dephospho-CoA synthase
MSHFSRCDVAVARSQQLGRAAVRALYAEISLEPKPGLVSFRDCGSHLDMDGSTFLRSLFALRGYFPRIAQAGAQGASFTVLQSLGKEAESRMLAATSGINTHRGAVFGLGLLCASAGQLQTQGLPLTPLHLRAVLVSTWGEALAERAKATRLAAPTSNGQRVAQRYGMRNAGDEAARAFPTLFDTTLPALQATLAWGATARAARVQALFATMAVLDDTNVVHRGGIEGLRFVQSSASRFIAMGGVMQADWLMQARAIHADFMQRRLSPGGAADVLASACWVGELSPAPPVKRHDASPPTSRVTPLALIGAS